MKEIVIKTLIDDTLRYNGLYVSENTLRDLTNFMSSNSMCLFAEDGLTPSDKIVRDHNGSILTESGKSAAYRVLVKSELKEFLDGIVDTESVEEAAAVNGVPKSRLLNESANNDFSYRRKIKSLSDTLSPLVTFVKYNNLAESNIDQNRASEYMKIINEFIKS